MVSFVETVRQARALLRDEGRISLRGLKREFDLDDDALEEIVQELVDVQQVAVREGGVLSWAGGAGAATTVTAPEARIANAGQAETANARPADAGERRHLTVMFCDLVDFTPLAERLDPEDLREVMRTYEESATRAIERYEGHVAKYLGDGLLAYFGYPQAHEDDAERAVRAGRELVAAIGTTNEALEPAYGIRLAVRVGVHTGLVVVGAMGSGAHRDSEALGATLNIAARLQGVAAPNSVVIGEATLRLIPGKFRTEDLGTPALKGVAQPIRVHAVLEPTGVRSRLDVDPSRLTPLVAREQEIGLLLHHWEQAQKGDGQAVLISGEAGVGKSRLLHAFRERLAAEPHGWVECRSSPYTQGTPFYPLIELLEHGLGYQPDDDDAVKLARLEGGLGAAGLATSETVPFVAPLLALPLPDRYPPRRESPQLQRTRLMEALVAWTFAMAERQPLVLLAEDLHWCDPSTIELLGLVLEQSPTTNLLTLLTFRPEFAVPWAARSHVEQLAVGRLRRRQAERLIGYVAREVPLPDPLVERIVARADGVPLFLEELTKMVLESDLVEERDGRYALVGELADLAIPTTLHDSLMARLDKLDAGKPVAQRGAALGREFTYELLAATSPIDGAALRHGLAQLVDAELIYQRGTPPNATYTFKHALVQNTAYQSLLKRTRTELHAHIAQVLRARFPERVEAEPELIARHCDLAGLVDDAILHYRRAGERAARASANREAIGHLERGLELAASLREGPERDRQELDLQLALAASLRTVEGVWHPATEAVYERVHTLASKIGDDAALARVLGEFASMHMFRGEQPRAIERAHEALAAAKRLGDPLPLVSAHSILVTVLRFSGDHAESLRHANRAIELYDPAVHGPLAHRLGTDYGVMARSVAAACRWMLGYPDKALSLVREAVQLGERVEHPYSVAWALLNAGDIHQQRGELASALERADEAIALGDRFGLAPEALGLASIIQNYVRACSDEPQAGIAGLRADLEALERGGFRALIPYVCAQLAEGLRNDQRFDEAFETIERGIETASETGQHYRDAELHQLRGELLLDRDGAAVEGAEGCFRRAIEIARSQQARSLELRAATSLARLWQRHGKDPEAHALLAAAYDWFTEGFETRDLKDAKALLDELH